MGLVNFSEALERFDGDVDIYVELIDTFLESGVADFRALRAELASGDVKQVAFRAHKLKGASVTLGGDELATVAGTLENALRERYANEILANKAAEGFQPSEYANLVDRIERSCAQTVEELTSLRKELRTPR